MRIVFNNIIPFRGFCAINLFGIVFIREFEWGYTEQDLALTVRHESIHTAQMKELLYVGFYVLYFMEWVFNLIFKKGNAYRNISFEKEAYSHEDEYEYVKRRKHFAQWRKG